MFGKEAQQWSVHAEFTISHPGAGDPANQPAARTEQGDNGVRMTYTWTAPPAASSLSASNSNRSTQSEAASGCQRGNMLFTSTPPPAKPRVHDSGYGSDLLSPNSLPPKRPGQTHGRKCRSTYNITLSANVHDENRNRTTEDTQCGRTLSLRCQTPTLRCEQQRKESYYGCGDPWCHHGHYGDDGSVRFSPVQEVSEDTTRTQTRCTASLPRDTRRDACVQTFEMIDKCTSPFFKYDWKEEKKARKYGGRRRTEPIFHGSNTPSSITPDSLDLDKRKVLRRVSRSSKLSRNKEACKERESTIDSAKLSDSSKKPRTVHIDVYCTGTEMESNESSDSSDNETASVSTPQTVFESEKVRITHQRANLEQTPLSIQKTKSKELVNDAKLAQDEPEESDDGVSSAYPSKLSSYSTIRDFSSSVSSVPPSWATYSMSSCAVPDDYDSVAGTSWKDTFSDIESLLHSRSSIAPTESLDFVPRKLYEKNASIDETPEIENKALLETPDSLQASDSFEYANNEDRIRIKKMEDFWNKNKAAKLKQWKSPQLERRHLLQQQKMQKYLEKRASDKSLPRWESKETDSESDDSGKAYTFLKDEKNETLAPIKTQARAQSKSPSILALQQRFSADPSLRAPFTIVPGIYTDPRAIAKKFGSILPVVRKPGHHIGPVKNPDCACEHCQRFYANLGQRGRTRSMGDPDVFQVINWKHVGNYPTAESNSNRSVPSQLFTDF